MSGIGLTQGREKVEGVLGWGCASGKTGNAIYRYLTPWVAIYHY